MPLSSYAVILAFQIHYILIRAGTLKAHCFIKCSKLSVFTKAEQQHIPQSDGMVEHFNRSLLQLLRCYVDSEDDWECYLPLVLYVYHTAQHSSTGASPFQLMFGRPPQSSLFQPSTAFDPNTYSAQLQTKLASLQDLVHSDITEAAQQQKLYYDKHSHVHSFVPGDLVWLSNPRSGKLQPRWQGKWRIPETKSPTDIKISDGQSIKVVHVNRLQHCKQSQYDSTS